MWVGYFFIYLLIFILFNFSKKGLGYAKLNVSEIKKKQNEKLFCSVCNFPFVYTKDDWKGEHPKQLLEKSLQKKFKKVNIQFFPVISKNCVSFLSKIFISYSDVKRELYDETLFGLNKRDSEAKTSLFAFHKLICEEKI